MTTGKENTGYFCPTYHSHLSNFVLKVSNVTLRDRHKGVTNRGKIKEGGLKGATYRVRFKGADLKGSLKEVDLKWSLEGVDLYGSLKEVILMWSLKRVDLKGWT